MQDIKQELIEEGLFDPNGMIAKMSELRLGNFDSDTGSLPDYEKMLKKIEEDFDATYKDIDAILQGDN